MSNAIVEYNQDQIELLKRTLAQDSTNDEFALFVNQCKRTGLDPFTRQIYFMKDKGGKVTVCSSIDGLRLVAERSGLYEGQTKPEWCGKDGIWKDIWLADEYPSAGRVGVWKKNFREATYGVALFDEYAGKYKDGNLTYMWEKMPALMIAKVAEALALRKAFPNDLSGIYSQEEGDVIASKIETKEARPSTPALQPPANADGQAKPNNSNTGAANKKPSGGTQAGKKNEQPAKKVDPGSKPKNDAPIDLSMASGLIKKLESKGKNGQKFYEWMETTYGTKLPTQLKQWQYLEIIDILERPSV